jgi:uncharacterized OsmC-like protein
MAIRQLLRHTYLPEFKGNIDDEAPYLPEQQVQWRTTMKAEDLRALQAPLKARYREEPEAAVITLRAEGKLGEGLTCRVETGKALVEAGLHPATGGTGLAACSGDMLLEALVACAGVTLSAVATAIGVEIRAGTVRAEGTLDFRGTLGVGQDVPVGFQQIALHFDLDSDASDEQLATLLRLTERYCVVYQTLQHTPEFHIAHHREPPSRQGVVAET